MAADAWIALATLVAGVEDGLARVPRTAERRQRAERIAARHTGLLAEWQATAKLERSLTPLAPSAFAAEIWEVIKDEDWVLANGTAKGWARRLLDWRPQPDHGRNGRGPGCARP